jgi:ribosomal protein S2
LRNDFVVFNGEHFLEYLNRCCFFCFNTINIGGTILFINSDNNYKKLTLFFSLRSLQRFYIDKWLGGLLTNNLFNNSVPDILIVSNLSQDTLILKEASSKLIPIICMEDSDHSLHKCFYSAFANDDKKDSIHLFYAALTNSMLKSFLLKYSNSLHK